MKKPAPPTLLIAELYASSFPVDDKHVYRLWLQAHRKYYGHELIEPRRSFRMARKVAFRYMERREFEVEERRRGIRIR